MHKKPLNLLILEDNETDAELMVRELRRSGYAPEWKRVQSEPDFSSSLNDKIDIVLSDFAMPGFDGLRALDLLKKRHCDIPFIIVSGTIGEDIAVKAMRKGAADYLLKDRLARLGQAVEHALEQKRLEAERKRAEAELRTLTEEHQLILNSAGDGIHGINLEGKIVFENPKACELLGWTAAELIGKPAHETIHHKHPDGSPYPIEKCPIYACMRDGATSRVTNDVFWRKNGSSFRVDYVAAPVRDATGKIRGSIVTFKDISEQFAAEQRLKLQEQQYRLLFETNPNPMWVFNTETLQIMAVNQVAIAQYGYSRDEFLKLTIKDLRPSEDIPDLVKARALSSPLALSHYSGQFRHKKKDGSLIVVEVYSSPLVWDGAAARIVSAIDVTGRKRAEGVVAESERRFREMLENVELIAMTLDKNGTVTFCNDYLLRLTGWSREEVIGANWFSIFIPETCPTLRELFFDSLAAGTIPAHYENPIKTRTGHLKEVIWNNTLLRDIEGNVIGTASLGDDVTERKQAVERLREQADIIDRAHDAVIIRDFESDKVTFWNNGAEHLYGWTKEEAVGKRLGNLIFGESMQRASLLERLLTTGEFHGEINHRCKDGRDVIVDTRTTLIRTDDGKPRAVIGINSDVTEKKRLEMQLLRAQRLESIGTLASGVAHDLNNVLTPIMMCSDILPRYIKGADGESTIKLIQESARRGAAIVKQVLTFARGVEGERVLIKLSHLIDEMIDIAKKTFPKLIDISSRYPEDLWTIEGDPTQLHQVLLNLSVNARDAMPDGGSLVIWAENVEIDANYAAMMPGATPGPYAAIRVSDTGSGMSRTTVEKIFDPFFTTKEIGKGTGLGLSTALGIVKSHGGFISVYSELEKGTTFRIFLPAVMSDQGVRRETASPALLHGSGELIMVIDDEQTILDVTKMILESKGYRVVTAHDGPEALAIFAQQMEDVRAVLTDMALPFMDGVALIRSLQKMKPQTAFIASTGQSEHVHAGELSKLGVTNLLTKPYDTQKLLESVHNAVAAAKR